MFDELPIAVQQQLLNYLATNNFRAAKELYDYYLSGKSQLTDMDDEELKTA